MSLENDPYRGLEDAYAVRTKLPTDVRTSQTQRVHATRKENRPRASSKRPRSYSIKTLRRVEKKSRLKHADVAIVLRSPLVNNNMVYSISRANQLLSRLRLRVDKTDGTLCVLNTQQDGRVESRYKAFSSFMSPGLLPSSS